MIVHRGVIPLQCDNECERCQTCLFREIDTHEWSFSLKRGVQQYGFEYNYARKQVDIKPAAGFETSAAVTAVANLVQPWFAELGSPPPNQCIINRYLAKERISAHTDHPRFGPVIATVSLLGETTMKFTRDGHDPVKVKLLPGDVVILTSDARDLWKHETSLITRAGYLRCSMTYRVV